MANYFEKKEEQRRELEKYYREKSNRRLKYAALAAGVEGPDKWWCRYPGLPFSVEGLHPTQVRRKAYQKFVRDYMRCGATIDDNIGRLLLALDSMGIADNTIVVYV